MSDLVAIFIITVAAYLLGSIPFGMLVTRLAGLGDIRRIGSGNIGATNVLRTGRKSLAFLTLVLDCGKGAVAVLLARYFYEARYLQDTVFDQRVLDYSYLAAFAAFVGHLFPVWLKFKGGKGVATAVGVITALAWQFGVKRDAIMDGGRRDNALFFLRVTPCPRACAVCLPLLRPPPRRLPWFCNLRPYRLQA